MEPMEKEYTTEGGNECPILERWDEFDLKTDLLRGIYAYGFENPSNIQKRAIYPITKGRDVIAQAQSGSGKTGAFTIGALQNIDIGSATIQTLIIVPTHELAKQISLVITHLGGMLEGLRVKTLIGGTSIQEDAQDLRENTPHVVVGCTGRIYDMINRNYLNTANIKLFILDEADEMLSYGFKEQIYNIFQHFNEDVQVALFSATMPPEIMRITDKFMRNPVKIIMKTEELNLECIQQYYVALGNDNAKYDMIKRLFEHLTISQCIIYVNSVNRVVDLHRSMTAEGFSVCCIHSSMTKAEREQAFYDFRNGKNRVMISSNITARGIDIQQVSTVINFDIPKCVHTYLHRIGRSGRWGRKGLAINFVTRQDIYTLRTIEKHYGSNILELPTNYKFTI